MTRPPQPSVPPAEETSRRGRVRATPPTTAPPFRCRRRARSRSGSGGAADPAPPRADFATAAFALLHVPWISTASPRIEFATAAPAASSGTPSSTSSGASGQTGQVRTSVRTLRSASADLSTQRPCQRRWPNRFLATIPVGLPAHPLRPDPLQSSSVEWISHHRHTPSRGISNGSLPVAAHWLLRGPPAGGLDLQIAAKWLSPSSPPKREAA